MRIVFKCGIKDVRTKMFASGDLGTSVIIEKDQLEPEKLALLNLMQYCPNNKSQELSITIDDGRPMPGTV